MGGNIQSVNTAPLPTLEACEPYTGVLHPLVGVLTPLELVVLVFLLAKKPEAVLTIVGQAVILSELKSTA